MVRKKDFDREVTMHATTVADASAEYRAIN
jgi:hypothetical protein